MDEIDPPDDITDIADLEAYLGELAAAHNDLVREVNRLDNLVVRALENSREAGEDVADLQGEVDRLRDQVEMVDATMPDQQKGKYEKMLAIVRAALDDGSQGPSGVKITTGHAATAAGSSRDTARRLMDEIGASFPWAECEAPGGPKPKELRISTRRHDEDDLVDDISAKLKGGA